MNFVWCSKTVSKKKALEFFIKLKSAISGLMIKTKENQNVTVTTSIGVTFGDLGSLEEMINQADQALYRAKDNGKNRVEVA